MAQSFNLTAQLQLQSPNNVNQVIGDIRKKLKDIGVSVKINANANTVAKVNKELQNTSKYSRQSTKSINELNRTLQESARRFSVITIATGTLLSLVSGFKRSVKEAIAFERELVRIAQTTGDSVAKLRSLSDEVSRLSTTLGSSSSELLSTARILAQAGFNAEQTRKSLDILAKTTLGASFDDINETTEGAIALLRQFSSEAAKSGGEIKFLEQSLDAINSVSKAFAVESSDLIAVIRRTGGVFAAAGGSVNELIALFTSVRATTRESAETIATGLRTIFTRIQRADTIDQLKQIGINLRDAEGNFVGAFEAVKRLSEGLSSIDPRSETFSKIVEELGGFRQVGKVIPLVQQFATAQKALSVAQSASGSIAKDAETAQQSLGVRIQKVREQFDELTRKFTESTAFNDFADAGLKLAEAFIKIADSLEPLLPLLTSLALLKLGKGIAPGIASLAGIGANQPSRFTNVSKFASGGFVPGSGNRDTVPAMLTPGEFVIRKSSVNKIGADTLAQMNANGYAAGGIVSGGKAFYGALSASGRPTSLFKGFLRNQGIEGEKGFNRLDADQQKQLISRFDNKDKISQAIKPNTPLIATLKDSEVIGGLFLQQGTGGTQGIKKDIQKGEELSSSGKFKNVRLVKGNISTGVLKKQPAESLREQIGPAVEMAVQTASANAIRGLEIDPFDIDEKLAAKEASSKIDLSSIEGFIFEAFISSLSGLKLAEIGDTFDFPKTTPATLKRLENFFETPVRGKLIDAKRTLNSETVQSGKSSIANKTLAAIKKGQLSESDFNFSPLQNQKKLPGFATGGSISGSDTVPAMLTPGEFVINKNSAQKIGYGNLNRMNKQGVTGYAKGGTVGVKRFAVGGRADSSFSQNIELGVSPSTAVDLFAQDLQDSLKNLGIFTDSLDDGAKANQEATEASKKNKKAIDDEKNSRDKQLTKLQKFGQGLEKLQRVSQSAQGFVFLGSVITSLTAQMSGLSDTTKVAVERTSVFVAGVVGITGTLVDTISGVILSMKAFNASVIASSATQRGGAVAGAVGGAIGGAGSAVAGVGGALSGLLGPLALLAVAIGGVYIAFKYFQEKYKAETDALINSTKKLRDTFEESGKGSEAYAESLINVANRLETQANKGFAIGPEAEKQRSTDALAAGYAVGPGGGRVGGREGVRRRQNEEKTIISKDLDSAIKESVKSFAELNEKTLSQKKALENLQSQTSLSDQDRQRRFFLTTQSQDINQQEFIAKAIEEAGKANNEQLTKAIESGQVSSLENALDLARNKPQELPGGAVRNIILLERSVALLDAAAKSAADELNNNQKALQDFLSNLTPEDAAKISESGIGAIQEGSDLSDLINNIRSNISAQSQAEIEKLKLQKDIFANTEEQKNAIQADIKKIEDLSKESEKVQLDSIIASARANIDIFNANQEVVKRQKAYADEIQRLIKIQSGFVQELNAFTDIEKQIQRGSTVRSGGLIGEATSLQETDLTNILDPDRFGSQLESIIQQTAARGGDVGDLNEFKNNLLQASSSISTLKESALSSGNLTVEAARELVERLPGIQPAIADSISENLSKAFVEGGNKLKPEAFDQAIKEYTESLSTQTNVFQSASSANQQYLNTYKAYLSEVSSLYDSDVESRKKYLDTFQATLSNSERALSLIRKSTGQEAGPSTSATLLAAESERVARQNLTTAGVGVQPGDLKGLEELRDAITKDLKTAGEQGVSNAGEAKALAENQLKLKAVNQELERLQSGTVQANAVFEQIENNIAVIEKERKAREQVTGVIEEFVIGGEDARKNLLNASQGIRQAFATGTLQLQSPEQRQATVGLLDKLSEVQLAPGVTGKQLKQELVFRDAIRMGLDPKIAEQLATATTVEERLIERNKQLAQEITTLNATMLEANRILSKREGIDLPAGLGAAAQAVNLPQQQIQQDAQIQKNQNLLNPAQQGPVLSKRLQFEKTELKRRKNLLGDKGFSEDDKETLKYLQALQRVEKSKGGDLSKKDKSKMNELKMRETLSQNIQRGEKRIGLLTGNTSSNIQPIQAQQGGVIQAIQQNPQPQVPENNVANMPNTLDNFIGNFSPILDNITKVFSGVSNSLNKLAESFGGFTMQHTVTVEGLINLGGLNIDTIKNELSKSIGQMVAEEVTKTLDQQSNNFQAGG